MLDVIEDKHSQSDECGAGSSSNSWELNQKKALMINNHDGLSSQSSVSGGRHEQTSPQDSVSSTFKEHDYIGVNRVEVSSQNKGSAGPKNLDLNLQETELRLGPLHSGEAKSGAPFQPKSIPGSNGGSHLDGGAGEPEAKSEGLELGIGLSKQNASTGHGQNKPSVERDMMLEKAGPQGPNQENGQFKAKGLSQSGSNQDGTVQRSSPSQWSSHMTQKQLDSGTSQASQKNHAIAGAKRVFAEAIGDGFAEGRSGFPMLSKLTGNPGGLTESELRAFSQLSKHPLLPPLYPWKTAKQSPMPHLGYMSSKVEGMPDSWESRSKASMEGSIDAAESNGTQQDKGEVDDTGGGSSTRAPVGWPPVQSFRKNTLSVPQPKKQTESKGVPSVVTSAATSTQNETTSLFVKVYMDGVSIGRKVEIKSHDNYDKLSLMLEEMFHHYINAEGAASKEVLPTDQKKLNFLSGSDYVLTYEDKDGDLMLVGDVPWKMFMRTVKRLRIMKGSDAIGLGPRGSD